MVQIYPRCLCIYGFVNKFWTGRIFERLRKVCGGLNLSTVLLLGGIYIKKCISLVQIYPKCRCIYGFVNVFIGRGDMPQAAGRPRAFTERPYGCGGLNLSTDPKWCAKRGNASTKLGKTYNKNAFRPTGEKLPQLFIIHQRSDFIIHSSTPRVRQMNNEWWIMKNE